MKGAGVIYLDAVWLLNLLMDAMILYLTQGVVRARSSKIRMFCAAFAASSIVPISIFMPDLWLTSTLGKLVFSLLIIGIAFSFTSLRAFILQLVSFYFITFSIGGSMLGVHFFLATEISIQGGSIVTFSGGYGDPVSWMFVCIGFPCSFFFTKWRMEQVSVHQMKLENIYDVKITWNGKEVLCRGMVDSGNQLIDPISRKMVFLADHTVMGQFLEPEVLEKLQVDQILTSMEELPSDIQSSVRLVPFQAAGSKGQLLVTVLVDQISIVTPQGNLEMKQPLVGVQHHDLTHDRLYQMLIHPHIMVKGKTA
ncbi:sigma-E processing peptidase SpoIIGA [Halobacillus halophilus]|uniref:Sporulation sigma-E factor-processing peptidase n=1 Tax=Halobacillus halophilus (strain ATCC 35676 / DSM 2266 / JCM 20832 / KCTC 3685 / LMG 17431 / NBRC 102448 / NCIMB 2269) TaxID=866895 RepID=I0JM58_HALH3|nr:sigma-E processing peptidase SpoIIGA [Halobacillus halophilus]ASF39320.1 sigma-E processing peptidase SpoIIGA [Halobacillus halophilus]CCG45228.1 sporulation sigma-E factor processing peptidase (stage II sporulation protein GA) [Halobacillus halophilus DSM 2266]